MEVRSPQNEHELADYYELRWQLLRKPWGETKGSERDQFEDSSHHIIAVEKNKIIGVARLQEINPQQLQLRYMAVAENTQKKGIGKAIVFYAEQYAQQHDYREIFLHARESAVGFYSHLNYQQLEKSYLLFDDIQHYKMHKTF